MNGVQLHQVLEKNIGLLIFGILFVSAIGGLVQVLPSLFQESLKTASPNTKVYSPLELVGRDVYIREGCSTCHSQQIRPLVAEVERYGTYSRAGEFVYDRPFLWGSKRTGPDLHRIGGKYSNEWHRIHLINPRDVVQNSIMPAYPWLAERAANQDGDIKNKLQVLVKLGHPYTDDDIESSGSMLERQSELDALIAYMQVLGNAYAKGDQ
ncbi:MAG: cytochrome-c oxidase, cbb3-type subunit II [Gammaproteobacteria bacterium]|nr:cytochrome-c oxidase, cbb3-type subunit II [Gammaproteobacteria bacterium]